MIATLQFSLPDEQDEHDTAVHAATWRIACEEIAEWLRREQKYADPKTAREKHRIATLREVQERVWEIMRDRGLDT